MMGEALFDFRGQRVCVIGYRGMLGSALVRRLANEDCRLLPLGRETLDVRDQAAVFAWFDEYRPDVVFLAAPRAAGSYANDRQRFRKGRQKVLRRAELIGLQLELPPTTGPPVRPPPFRLPAEAPGQ